MSEKLGFNASTVTIDVMFDSMAQNRSQSISISDSNLGNFARQAVGGIVQQNAAYID